MNSSAVTPGDTPAQGASVHELNEANNKADTRILPAVYFLNLCITDEHLSQTVVDTSFRSYKMGYYVRKARGESTRLRKAIFGSTHLANMATQAVKTYPGAKSQLKDLLSGSYGDLYRYIALLATEENVTKFWGPVKRFVNLGELGDNGTYSEAKRYMKVVFASSIVAAMKKQPAILDLFTPAAEDAGAVDGSVPEAKEIKLPYQGIHAFVSNVPELFNLPRPGDLP